MSTVKFPDGMNPIGAISGQDKLMVAKAESGEVFQSTWDKAKDYLSITGELIDPVDPGTLGAPAQLPIPPVGQKRKFEPQAGYYTFGSADFHVTADKRWYFFWNGNTWSLKDMGELPKGADGKTIEQFNAAKPSGYVAGDQFFFNGDAIYEVKVGQTATTGQSPNTNPEKFDLIFTGGGLISSGSSTSNENLFLQGRISDKGVPTKDEKALYTDFIAVNKKGFTITVNSGIRFTIDKYNQNKELLEHQTTNRINTYTDSNNTSDFIRLSITKTDGSTLTPSDTSAVGLIVKTTIAKKDPLVDSVLKEFVTQNLTEVNIQDVKVSNVRLNMIEEVYHSGYATTAFIAIKGLSFSIINDLTPSSTVISVVNYDKNFKKLDSFTSNGILFVENKESKIEFIRIAINNPGAIAPLSLFKLYKGFSSVTDIAKNGLEKSSEKLDSSPEFTVQLSTSIDSLKFEQGVLNAVEFVDGSLKNIISNFIDVNYKPFSINKNSGFDISVLCFDEFKNLIRNPLEYDKTSFDYLDTRYVRFNVKRTDATNMLVANANDIGLIVSRTSSKTSVKKRYFNALDYGVSESNQNNTLALRKVCNKAFSSGGGTVYIPNGKYNFSRISQYAQICYTYPNVTIEGEHRDGTILNLQGSAYSPFFGNTLKKTDILEGGVFKNFTVRGTDLVPTTAYDTAGKAFFIQYLRSCLFENLKLEDTLSTSLGIDFLHDTHINKVHVINGGRGARLTGSLYGGAGIGIGSGYWDDEFFTITDCISENSMNYGIFIEHQKRFGSHPEDGKARGNIVSGNICKNNTRSGLGLVAVQKTMVTDNISFGNGDYGLDVKYRNIDVIVANNMFLENGSHGVNLESNGGGLEGRLESFQLSNNIIKLNGGDGVKVAGDTTQEKRIGASIKSNTISNNIGIGINIDRPTDTMSIRDNDTFGNSRGLFIKDSHKDFICKGNAFVDGVDKTAASFTGILTNSDL